MAALVTAVQPELGRVKGSGRYRYIGTVRNAKGHGGVAPLSHLQASPVPLPVCRARYY